MPESPPPRPGLPDRIVPGRIGLAPKGSVGEALAAMDRVSRTPRHPDYIPGHTSEEVALKLAAARLPATPLQIGAGLMTGAVGLRALLRKYAPRPAAPAAPFGGPQEDEMAIKSASPIPGFDPAVFSRGGGMPDGPDAFAPGAVSPNPFAGGPLNLPPEVPPRPAPYPAQAGPPRPPAVPRGYGPGAYDSFRPSPSLYTADPSDFQPQGLLSRLRGFYDESVAPHVQDAAGWANEYPLRTVGLLGLGGLGAYGAYRAMQPDEEDEADGPVKMGGLLSSRREAAERPGFFPVTPRVNLDIPRS